MKKVGKSCETDCLALSVNRAPLKLEIAKMRTRDCTLQLYYIISLGDDHAGCSLTLCNWEREAICLFRPAGTRQGGICTAGSTEKQGSQPPVLHHWAEEGAGGKAAWWAFPEASRRMKNRRSWYETMYHEIGWFMNDEDSSSGV